MFEVYFIKLCFKMRLISGLSDGIMGFIRLTVTQQQTILRCDLGKIRGNNRFILNMKKELAKNSK